MDIATLVAALAPAFASGFALQRLLEILDPILDKIRSGEHKKVVLGLISFSSGLGLAAWPRMRVLSHLVVTPEYVPQFVDYMVTALILSGGTEGFNSILKFLNYKKEETKAAAVSETLEANMKRRRMTLAVGNELDLTMTSNECLVWRQGEFSKRVRKAVAEWAEEPATSIMPNNTLGELAKHSEWGAGQQARLTQVTNANSVFAPPFPNTKMSALSQVLSGSTTVAQWEKVVWRQQNPETPCFPFTD
jgi:hypothetical protein